MSDHEYIAIDIGTSFIKGAVVDVRRLTISHIRRSAPPTRMANSSAAFHELAPDAVVESTRSLISELLATSAVDCRGILLCGQMGGLVLSTDTGGAVSNYISWLDRRATLETEPGAGSSFDRFTALAGDGASQRLGNEFRPGLPLPFLHWLLEHGALRESGGAIPVTLPDFVAASLCGATPVMEWTTATGTLDVQTGTLPTDLIGRLGLDHLRWPELVDFRTQVGLCRIDGVELPVFAAVGDHQCSLAGTCLSAGELSLNISTGSQVAMVTDGPETGDFQVRPFFDGRFLKTITNIPAGRALNVLMNLLTEIGTAQQLSQADAWNYFFAQAEDAEESDLEVNLAFFPSPVIGPGSIGNIREDNLTVGRLARASLEQMAAYYDALANRLSPRRDWSRLVFAGGIAQSSALLRRLILQRLGEVHRMTSSTEDALHGLMVLGRVISGLNDTVADAADDCQKQFAS